MICEWLKSCPLHLLRVKTVLCFLTSQTNQNFGHFKVLLYHTDGSCHSSKLAKYILGTIVKGPLFTAALAVPGTLWLCIEYGMIVIAY